jgi:2-polyprenyl-3-methyl-5-hydroxy-6-metoxy-1,4-benzoquinol methylase
LQKCKQLFYNNLQKCKKGISVESDRLKWNQRFESEDTYLGRNPSPFLSRAMETIKQITPGTQALDVACGEGRNSIFLAKLGFCVTALDISDVGLEKGGVLAGIEGVDINFRRVDLDGYCFTGQFDVIINFNFLLRDLIPKEVEALSPGGLLIVDTIMESPELLASHKNPAFFLRRGELQRICDGLPGEILIYEEQPDEQMPTARVLFRRSIAT